MDMETSKPFDARPPGSPLVALKHHWKLAGILAVLSAAAGVYSQVLVSAGKRQPGSFSGPHLHANWTSGDLHTGTWTSANVWAQGNFVLPFVDQDKMLRGQSATIAAVNVSSADWHSGTLSQVWGFAPIPDDALFVAKNLSRGGVQAVIPATVETFSDGGWDRRQNVPLNISLVLANQQGVRDQRLDTWNSDPFSGRSSHWDSTGPLGLDAQGTGELSIRDGTANTILISEKTATTWGELGRVQRGQFVPTTWDNSQ